MLVSPLARSLLGAGHGSSNGNMDYSQDEVVIHDDTKTLRIVSIFVILSTGLLGGLPPLFIKVFRNPDSLLTKFVRAFAAGVILALALVHIIPEAVADMTGLGGIEYPLGGTCVLFGVALMVFLEHMAHIMHSSSGSPTAALPPNAVHHHHAGGADGAAAALLSLDPCSAKLPVWRQQQQQQPQPQAQLQRQHSHGHGKSEGPGPGSCSGPGQGHGHGHGLAAGQGQNASGGPVGTGTGTAGAANYAVVLLDGPAAAAVAEATELKPRLTSEDSGGCCGRVSAGVGEESALPGHGHVCVSRGSASNWVTAAAVEAVGSLRLKVVAYLFELGCIFHSFIIGLSLGVNQTDLTEVRSLLIALAFHQWLEGISLASVVVRGGFSVWRGCVMILTYSLTCPVGIAVGMAIASTYDGESERARGVQGTLNGVSGGMLLYISLVQLVAEDMGRLVPGRDSAVSRLCSCGAMFGGAAAMCLLAVWA